MIRFKSLVIYSNIQSVPEISMCGKKPKAINIFTASRNIGFGLLRHKSKRPHTRAPQYVYSAPITFHEHPKYFSRAPQKLVPGFKYFLKIVNHDFFLRAPQYIFCYEIIWMLWANFSECSKLSIMIEIF